MPQFVGPAPKTDVIQIVGIGAAMFLAMVLPFSLLLAYFHRKGYSIHFDAATGFTFKQGRSTSHEMEYDLKSGSFQMDSSGVLSSRDGFPTLVYPKTRVTEGRSYFEIEVVEVGGMPQLGWADADFTVGRGSGVGDDEHSWGIDGARRMVWPERRFGKKWRKGKRSDKHVR